MRPLSFFLLLPFVCFQSLGASYLRGKVVLLNASGAPEGTAKNLKVTVVQSHNSDVTTADGQFRIPLAGWQVAGSEYELQIDDPQFRIYHPLGGRDRIPAKPDQEVVTVELLPKGSRLFLLSVLAIIEGEDSK